jgi:uncharacterized low-complexity protein
MSNLKKSVSIAIGATFAASMAASPIANADQSPFGMQNLESGYMQVAEGKCGENMKKDKEGTCGEGKASKEKEGTCGEGKMPAKEKEKEGKCGEAKCGANN